MKLIKQTITVLFILLLFLILYENYDNLQHAFSFKLNLYFIGWYTSKIPVWLIILIAFACGYAIAYITGFIQRISYKKKIKQIEQKLQTVDTAVSPAKGEEKTVRMDDSSQTDGITTDTHH
ncbi:MAG: lipopolysaccharide assembly protein LapA domain-containing protein [Deltaproteobacteria bacterium]|nr:lipopolysaccharide assembly protein LapA domain-containing protein [Deltaproteobacteria bacterium]